jgi:Tfp pilus assembly protein PilF
MDKPQEAAKYLRMAVQSDPLNGAAHYRLASVSRTLGLKDEAAKEFRLFQEIKQTKKDLKELYRQMNKTPPEQEEQVPDAAP